ncbi:MAG TPA: BON domain-containing protein [Longimicrobiales bacterium]
MPRDYEDIHDIEHMGDQEIADLISQEPSEYPDVDVDDLDIRVQEGFVTLGGRVGTEHELQVVAQVVGDLLGIRTYSNEIVVDEARRAEMPEAADEEIAMDESAAPQTGRAADETSDTADHLIEHLDEEMYSTHDLQKAIEQGMNYEAPDRPVQEGTWSEENH